MTMPATTLNQVTAPSTSIVAREQCLNMPLKKKVQWGWATVYTMSDVPICSYMTDVERERLWWLPHELLQFKENYREVQAGLDDKRKGSFARLFASRNVMKLQANGYGQPLNPIEVSNMLHKINGYTLRSALKRAADLMNDLQRIRQFDCDKGLDESVCSTRSKSHYKRSLSLDSIDEAKHSLLNATIHTRSASPDAPESLKRCRDIMELASNAMPKIFEEPLLQSTDQSCILDLLPRSRKQQKIIRM